MRNSIRRGLAELVMTAVGAAAFLGCAPQDAGSFGKYGFPPAPKLLSFPAPPKPIPVPVIPKLPPVAPMPAPNVPMPAEEMLRLDQPKEENTKKYAILIGRANVSFPRFGHSEYKPQVGEGLALYRKGEGNFGVELGVDKVKYEKRDGTEEGQSTLLAFNLLYFPDNGANWFVGTGGGLMDEVSLGGLTTGYIFGNRNISGVAEFSLFFPLKHGGVKETMALLYTGVGVSF